MVLEVTDSNFEEIVLKSEKPVIVDFWAEWCGPCRRIAPFIEEISKEYEGKVVVAKCNVDNNPEVVSKLGIRNIPSVIYFKNGKEVDRQVGAVAKNIFTDKLEKLL
ncbi:MAG TPA: thioredoxin [Bacteroidales bacterium]|nr:thioredoxin [Bacteroidales bacterium]